MGVSPVATRFKTPCSAALKQIEAMQQFSWHEDHTVMEDSCCRALWYA